MATELLFCKVPFIGFVQNSLQDQNIDLEKRFSLSYDLLMFSRNIFEPL